jgi:hypothetical protein
MCILVLALSWLSALLGMPNSGRELKPLLYPLVSEVMGSPIQDGVKVEKKW